MTETGMTAKELEEQWWWRHENNFWTYDPRDHTTTARGNWANVSEDSGPIRVSPFVEEGEEHFRSLLVTEPWKGAVEWSAHAYELIRRAQGEPLLRTYIELNLEEQRFLMEHLGGPHEPSPWVAFGTKASHLKGFSEPVRWNLGRFSDGDLCTAFARWLRTQRKIGGVASPDTTDPASVANPSWQWAEVLDLERCGLQTHHHFDSNILRPARERATQLASEFWELIRHAHVHGLEWPGVPEPERSVTIV